MCWSCRKALQGIIGGVLLANVLSFAQGERERTLVKQLRELQADVYTDAQGVQRMRQAWPTLLREQIGEANRRSSEEWTRIQTREDWEKFRQEKLQALRVALNIPREPPKPSKVVVTGRIPGEGYRIENLLYESRPGLWVSANLYMPDAAKAPRPGLLIVHSHHTPKWHSELQDMGILWAKAGAAVLIPDLLGHGERRIHPFVDEKSYPEPFRPSRQDYYFRYNLALQLYLMGETLMGWMVWDLRCGIGVLLEHAQADPQRIAILGSVAGGGDVAAVTAAADERISAAVVFNFGGPEPEDPYPLPENARESFNYAGSGSWESTRNLVHSARDGFLPWVIVASIAPRGLCYAHEFGWDRERDPIWPRLQRVWGFYQASDRLRFAHGRGVLTGKPPENTHCTHIGAVHRQAGVYQALRDWFGLPVPEKENTHHHTVRELTCWTDDARHLCKPLPWAKWLPAWHRDQYQSIKPQAGPSRQAEVMPAWEQWCKRHQKRRNGADITVGVEVSRLQVAGAEAVWHVLYNVDGMAVPLLLLLPREAKEQLPCVLVLCSQGKARFLRERAEALARLLERGVAVCLADLRDCGETATSAPGRNTASNAHAATALMLGESVEEQRLYDAIAILRWLRGQITTPSAGGGLPIDGKRLAVWGENLAPTNPADKILAVPWDASKLPYLTDPSAARVALWLAATDVQLRGVYAAGDVAAYWQALESPFLYLPLGAIRPGMLRCRQPSDAIRGQGYFSGQDSETSRLLTESRTAVRLEALVNPANQPLDQAALDKIFASVLHQRAVGNKLLVEIQAQRSPPPFVADWLTKQLAP